MFLKSILAVNIFLCLMFIYSAEAVEHHDYDKELAAKYGLEVPEPEEKLDPAPKWVQEADMFTAAWSSITENMNTFNREVWNGYDIEFRYIPFLTPLNRPSYACTWIRDLPLRSLRIKTRISKAIPRTVKRPAALRIVITAKLYLPVNGL